MLNRRDALKSGVLSLGSLGLFGNFFTKSVKNNTELTPALVEGQRTWQNFDKSNLNFDLYENYKSWNKYITNSARYYHLGCSCNFANLAAILETQKRYLTWKFAGFDVGVNKIVHLTTRCVLDVFASQKFSDLKLRYNLIKNAETTKLTENCAINQIIHNQLDANRDVIFYMRRDKIEEKLWPNCNWFDVETGKELPYKNYYLHYIEKCHVDHNTSYAINSDATFETDILFDVNFDLTGTLRFEINGNI